MATALSDKALGVFAFAAYHQFTSGQKVTDVALHDGAGHAADAQAIEELEALGLVEVADDRAVFTAAGQAMVGRVLDAIRSAGP